MITKKDYFLISIVGILFGLLLLPVLKNIKFFPTGITFAKSALLVLSFFVLANVALWVASLVARRFAVVLEIAKFAAIGGLNTLLDLGVLNVLIIFTGVAAGYQYSLFKGISFVAANINSYFWNKYWTFDSQGGASVKEFAEFLVVSFIGFGINIGIASAVVNLIGAPAGMSPEVWANVGAVSATLVSLVWNFFGYKLVVFRKNKVDNARLT